MAAPTGKIKITPCSDVEYLIKEYQVTESHAKIMRKNQEEGKNVLIQF